ncbi:conjugal transfer protein [Ralstonia nicotianae]|uniref:conjugal transfer protein n=1 Tax=Ralstonia pseudosolanacearum TaxID=1310165 RepID=UPI002006D16F|nr:conjugal transfer protein [Ralstonia pseudosolanacearum]MCK4118408.1 conjugal transfer protein [Ralstonia pseudosolanacearum]
MRQHKVSRSLSLPRTVGGAVRGFAIANGTVTALLIYATFSAGWQMVAGFAALGTTSHLLLRWLTNRDPWWNQILLVYDLYADVYEPGPWHGKFAARFQRPYGFDAYLPC